MCTYIVYSIITVSDRDSISKLAGPQTCVELVSSQMTCPFFFFSDPHHLPYLQEDKLDMPCLQHD